MRLVAQSRPTLRDPLDCNLPGSSVHGIFQARILERDALSFSKGSSQPREWTPVSPALQVDSSSSEPPGKPQCQRCVPFKRIILLPPIDGQLSSETFMLGKRVGAEKISPKELRRLSFGGRVIINAGRTWAFASLPSYISEHLSQSPCTLDPSMHHSLPLWEEIVISFDIWIHICDIWVYLIVLLGGQVGDFIL